MTPDKLNLGCGFYQIIDGWINLDFMSHYPYRYFLYYLKRILHPIGLYHNPTWPDQQIFFQKVVNHNILKGIPLKDQSVDLIYASHFLEHFTLEEAAFILRECLRIMQSGAVLRLVVPDLKRFVRAYQTNDLEFTSYLARRYPEFDRIKDATDALNLIFHVAGHCYIYDFEKLHQLGSDCGFVSICQKNHGDSNVPELNRAEIPRHENLVVEMFKK